VRWFYLFPVALAAFLAASPLVFGDETASHWKRPVEAASARMEAASLRPEACAVCHEARYAEWKGALHSRSAGPGLTFQLDPAADPEFYVSCLFCHAPLSSQSEVREAKGGGYSENPSFDDSLMRSGVSCAACHVRGGVVYGPVSPSVGAGTPAGHLTSPDSLFAGPEFCAACHQLDGGYGFSGSPLVNTYREWEQSGYREKGITCQKCHMPDRRHLFKGIHDLAMVRDAVSVLAERQGNGVLLRIENTGVGHYFPTYATPLVVIRGFQADGQGEEVEASAKESYIGRRVTLDLSEELFDTRLAPGEAFEFTYDRPLKDGSRAIVIEVVVHPDEFYRRFYESALGLDGMKDRESEIREALGAANSSSYHLFRRNFPLRGEAAIDGFSVPVRIRPSSSAE